MPLTVKRMYLVFDNTFSLICMFNHVQLLDISLHKALVIRHQQVTPVTQWTCVKSSLMHIDIIMIT